MDPMPPLPFFEDTLRLSAGGILFHRGLQYGAQGYVRGADAEARTAQIRDLRTQNRRRPVLQDEFTTAGMPR